MENNIRYEGISWNAKWIQGIKKAEDFVKHPANAGKFKENAAAKLKELHALVHGKPKKEAAPDPANAEDQ